VTCRPLFVDIDDVAEIAVESLTDDRRIGELYELTGPRLLTFAQAAAEISKAASREITYTPVSLDQHAVELAEHGVAPEVVDLLTRAAPGGRLGFSRSRLREMR
jgi:uncharacterized protein YbjT (DUF2867 family)